MNVSSAAGYLINRAVKLASGLDQDSKESASRAAFAGSRPKGSAQGTDLSNMSRKSSSAYRVSLSSSAMQRVSMDNASI